MKAQERMWPGDRHLEKRGDKAEAVRRRQEEQGSAGPTSVPGSFTSCGRFLTYERKGWAVLWAEMCSL